MAIGTKSTRSSRTYAAPRRRFRSEDDAGYLGDAPILLNLPSLCGVPDVEGPGSDEAPEEQQTPETTAEAAPRATVEERDANHEAGDREPALAKPEFLTSQADAEQPHEDEAPEEEPHAADAYGGDHDHGEEHDEEHDERDEPAPPIPSGNVHRKIITWTAIFVAAASLYLYAKRDRPEQAEAPPAVDIDMGWESSDNFGSDNNYGGGDTPVIDMGLTPESAPAPAAEQPLHAAPPEPIGAPALAMPQKLPTLNEAGTYQPSLTAPNSAVTPYPTTSTPDASYELTERPIRTGSRTDAGSSASPVDGLAPISEISP